MTEHRNLISKASVFVEVEAKTMKQFSRFPTPDLQMAKEWFSNATNMQLAACQTGYAFSTWDLAKMNPDVAQLWKMEKDFRDMKTYVLPKAYVNNTDEYKKYVYLTLFSVYNHGERCFITNILSSANKFLCVGGPLNKSYQTYEDVKEEYSMFNNNGYSRSKNSHSAILVHTSIVE